MEFLREFTKEEGNIFEQLSEYLKKIKEIVKKEIPDAEIYLYGSVVEGKSSIGLNDIDVAIVSEGFKDREKSLKYLEN